MMCSRALGIVPYHAHQKLEKGEKHGCKSSYREHREKDQSNT